MKKIKQLFIALFLIVSLIAAYMPVSGDTADSVSESLSNKPDTPKDISYTTTDESVVKEQLQDEIPEVNVQSFYAGIENSAEINPFEKIFFNCRGMVYNNNSTRNYLNDKDVAYSYAAFGGKTWANYSTLERCTALDANKTSYRLNMKFNDAITEKPSNAGPNYELTDYTYGFINSNTDISLIKNDGYVVFNCYFNTDVDFTGLYFSIGTKTFADSATGNLINIIGVPVGKYVSESDKGKVLYVTIPLSEFTLQKSDNFAQQYTSGWIKRNGAAELEWDKFYSVGLVRKADLSKTSDQKIYVGGISFFGVSPITGINTSLNNEKDNVTVSWTKSDTEGIDGYNIYRISEDEAENTLLASVTSDVNEYNDSSVGYENTYTYYVEAYVNTQIDGKQILLKSIAIEAIIYVGSFTSIPETGTNTEKNIYSQRNGGWGKLFTNEGVPFYNIAWYIQKGNKVITDQDSCPDLCSDAKVLLYNMKFNQVRTSITKDDTDGNLQVLYDYYFGIAIPTNTVDYGRDISKYENSGYILYHLQLDKNVDLEGLYLVAGSFPLKNGNLADIIGIPVSKYVSASDLGKPLYIKIPMSEFNTSINGNIGIEMTSGWVAPGVAPTKVNWANMGLYGLGRYDKFTNKPNIDQKVWVERVSVSSVDGIQDLTVKDVTLNKVIMSWEHSPSKIEKYNVYRDGQFIGSSKVNGFIDKDNLERDITYTYSVEAVDKCGVTSPKENVSVYVSSIDTPRNFRAAGIFKDDTTKPSNLISWMPSEFGDVGDYILYRNNIEYKKFGNSVTSFTDTDVTVGTEYAYSMKAISASGNSSFETQKITVDAGCLATPRNLIYTASEEKIDISWNPSQYAVKYNIYVNGELAGTTENSSFTYNNVSTYREYIISVRAINKVDAYSAFAKSNGFFVLDPGIDNTKSLTIFDDNINSTSGFDIDLSGGAQTQIYKIGMVGSKSLQVKIPYIGYDEKSATFKKANGCDLSTYRNSGGRLGFWIHSDDDVDFSKYSVRLGAKTSLGTTPLRTSVNLGNYASKNGDDWKYVKIPLSDFSDKGVTIKNIQKITGTMDYSAITEISIVNDYTDDNFDDIFYLDDFKVEIGKDWVIEDVMEESGNKISDGGTISAANQKLVIQFEDNMEKGSLNNSTVYITDGNGKSLNCYGIYSSDKKYTLYLLDSMSKNTDYTLTVSGAKTILNKRNLSFAINFITDSTEPNEISNSIPKVKANITSATSGSLLTASINFDNDVQYLASNYNIQINYPNDLIIPNSETSVNITGLSDDATVSMDDTKIRIYGSSDQVILLNNAVITVDFAVAKSGEAEISVNGDIGVSNPKAQKINKTDVEGLKKIVISTSSKTDGKSKDGGGGSGSSAKRENGLSLDIPSISPIIIEEPKFSASFSDVDELPWASESIKWLAQKGYVNGYSDGTFHPSQVLTREEFVKMIAVTFELYADNDLCKFSDVPQDAWYREYISQVIRERIVTGKSEAEFGVGQPITREDMCTILYRAATTQRLKMTELFDMPLFSDSGEISDYASEAIKYLYKWGVINGVSDDEFAPKEEVNRAMAAKALYEMLKLKK